MTTCAAAAPVQMPAVLRRSASVPAGARLAHAEPKPPAACVACLEECREPVSLCEGRRCGTVMCASCALAYLESAVGDRPRAYCPVVRCPGCRSFVRSAVWGPHAPRAVVRAFDASAAAMCSLQCGACHCRSSLLPAASRGGAADMEFCAAALEEKDVAEGLARHLAGERDGTEALVDALARFAENRPDGPHCGAVAECERAQAEFDRWVTDTPAYQSLLHDLARLARGTEQRYRARLEADRMARPVRKRLGLDKLRHALSVRGLLEKRGRGSPAAGGSPALHAVVRAASVLVDCAERRATLFLTFVRRSPTVRSPCCKKAHCFACKVRAVHADPEACRALAAQRPSRDAHQNVRVCPTASCRLPIVKTEGCSSVTCPACGNRFNFNAAERW